MADMDMNAGTNMLVSARQRVKIWTGQVDELSSHLPQAQSFGEQLWFHWPLPTVGVTGVKYLSNLNQRGMNLVLVSLFSMIKILKRLLIWLILSH